MDVSQTLRGIGVLPGGYPVLKTLYKPLEDGPTSEPQLLETRLPHTPKSARHGGEELPDELLRDATHRLGLVALVWAGLFVTGIGLNDLVARFLPLSMRDLIPWSRAADVVSVVSIGASVALWRYTRHLSCEPRFALDVALGYEVLLAFGIGLVNQWEPQQVLAGRLSLICMPVLLFPMIVPNTPWKTLVASLLAASMDPVGILIAHWRGLEVPSLTVIGWNYLPNYICAVLAVIPSEIVTRLGHQVQRARELGSYRLVELIGRGGMGEVWRATHRMLARPAAIKLIRTDGGGLSQSQAGELVRRFRREAEAASLLESPHTIRLYDFGESRAGTFYCVMELLDGLDLETLVRRYGPVPADRAVYLLRQVCHSLGEAHERGLIHRDVKPANIYLCRLGREYDFIKVLDFGLVKHEQDRSVLGTMKSAPELSTAGTPAYIAPEAVSGETVDRRADLYALGCVAYWMLTGHLVFQAETPLQMLIQHVQATPVPPSQRTAQPVPPTLERLILRCLEKQPDDRPASADEIAAELDALAAGASWDQEQARAWWQARVARVGGAPTERWVDSNAA